MAQLEKFSLKVFRTVAEHLSFRKARVAVPNATCVSLQIKALEETLAYACSTAPRVKSHSQAGCDPFVPRSKTCKDRPRSTARTLRQRGSIVGTFALGVSTTIAQYVLPRFLAIFLAEHPRLQVSVQSANTDAMSASARWQGLHRSHRGSRAAARHTRKPFMETNLSSSPGGFRIRSCVSGSIDDLTLLLREPGSGSRRVVEAALRKAHLKLNLFKNVIELIPQRPSNQQPRSAGPWFCFLLCDQQRIELQALKLVEVDGVRIARHYFVVSLTGPEPRCAVRSTFALDRARHLSKGRGNPLVPAGFAIRKANGD